VVTDYGAVRAALENDRDGYRIREVGFDPWNAVQLAAELGEDGWTMLPMGQSARAMTASTAELLRLFAAGLFHHGGSGIMRWQAGNAVTRTDANGNVKLDRQKSAEKIDGLVAATMGLDRALRRIAEAEDYAAAGW
jgi:phage terminase large subunit-like protein